MAKKPAKGRKPPRPAPDVPPEPPPTVRTLEGEDVPAAELAHLHPFVQRFAVRADSLVRDPDNARLHTERNLQAVAHSLRTYGQQPLLLSFDPGTRVIKVGNGRHEVATDPKWGLNWRWIAAVPSNLAPAELKAFALADNRTAELAEWDPAVVERQLQELTDELAGFDAGGLGFDAKELDALLKGDLQQAHGFTPGGRKPAPPAEPEPQKDDGKLSYTPKWLLVVTCGSEQQQAELIEEFERRGLNVKAPSA